MPFTEITSAVLSMQKHTETAALALLCAVFSVGVASRWVLCAGLGSTIKRGCWKHTEEGNKAGRKAGRACSVRRG